jgi:cytochrome c-type biogenesis protein CcmH
VKRLLLATLGALALAGPATAADCGGILADLENEVMCPVCPAETIGQSQAPLARRMKTFIVERCRAGDTKAEIKTRLVDNFGPSVLAAPSKKGFDLLAWLLPLAGAVAAAGVVGYVAWRWTRQRERAAGPPVGSRNGRPLEPELERRVDEELARFDA